jgi:RND family efflux transporter MFP subunit
MNSSGLALSTSEVGPRPFFARTSTNRRKLTIGLIVLSVVAGVSVGGRQWMASAVRSREVVATDVAPASVRVLALQPEVVASGLRYSAAVKELHKAELSFRVGGTVEALHQVTGHGGRLRNIHEGDVIPKGTALAQLDRSDYRRERGVAGEKLATAEARLDQQDAEFGLAQVELRRTDQLVRRKASTSADLDSAKAKQLSAQAAVQAARRDVESAKIDLEQADANLSYCTLVSPFEEGTVAARYLEGGERIAANQRAFLLLDLSSVVIAFGVPDTAVGRLSIGQTFEVTSDALPGRRFEGTMHKIGSMADAQTRTYAVEVRIDKPEGLRPGMIATVAFRREVKAHLLPLTAIVPRVAGSGYDVYRVVEEDGRDVVRTTPVVFEDVLDNRIAVRLDGQAGALRDGDRVVATGTHRLHDGQAVQVVE